VTVSLRPGTLDDMPALGALFYRSRLAAYREIIALGDLEAVPAEALTAWWTERWTYEQDTHRFTVAERDGRLVGFTYLGPDEDDHDAVQLYAIHLEPDEQGRGTGRTLMIDALAHMTGKPAVLWVLTDNARTRRFYERGGWAPDGRTRTGTIGTAEVGMLRYRYWLGESA